MSYGQTEPMVRLAGLKGNTNDEAYVPEVMNVYSDLREVPASTGAPDHCIENIMHKAAYQDIRTEDIFNGCCEVRSETLKNGHIDIRIRLNRHTSPNISGGKKTTDKGILG